jgi:hypothetical protein
MDKHEVQRRNLFSVESSHSQAGGLENEASDGCADAGWFVCHFCVKLGREGPHSKDRHKGMG